MTLEEMTFERNNDIQGPAVLSCVTLVNYSFCMSVSSYVKHEY